MNYTDATGNDFRLKSACIWVEKPKIQCRCRTANTQHSTVNTQQPTVNSQLSTIF
ncbi:hypothetical protein AVDCRST_MAG84-1300 [uncultured Microcoleus sp.]|uniref:Uncharacterized protein n=1 Tax=uncultured Microcoleus sp. TaxID=259945 RepID=A0A6J4KZS1_9CYAN|nr:hypothetical protein AVDCRST_MAG84-1300 [uncultured Microcoleus sp.]